MKKLKLVLVAFICLFQVAFISAQSICADFTGTTPQYLQDITVNNTLYPVGTVVFQTGDIKFRKAGMPCQFISASGDTLCYIGKIEIDVTSAPYPQRQLTFYSIITQGMIVDGDTIFQNSNPVPQYNGVGFTVNYLNNIFTITGAFDTVHIFGSTNCLSAVCLSPDSVSTQSCADFTGTNPQYLQDISMNNTLYPIGTVVFQTGDIKFRKAGVPCQFISASGDTLCYIGKIEIDITSAPYPQRQLTFYSIITQGMIVDGDTIFQNSNPVPQYNGVGFTVNYLNNIFTITGAFDTVHIFGSTNCLSAVCLSSIPTHQESELLDVQDVFELYPNPAENEFVVDNDSEQSADLRIFSIQGELIYSEAISSGKTQVNIEQFQSGIYFVQLATENGLLYSKRLVVRK